MIVQQGNKQLKVPEEAKDMYLSLGYSVIDDKTGDIKEAGHATDLAGIKAENDTLKSKLAEYKENSDKLDQLEAVLKENETLKAQVAELTAQLEAANKKSK
jgi:cell shape-determining protein MreC